MPANKYYIIYMYDFSKILISFSSTLPSLIIACSFPGWGRLGWGENRIFVTYSPHSNSPRPGREPCAMFRTTLYLFLTFSSFAKRFSKSAFCFSNVSIVFCCASIVASSLSTLSKYDFTCSVKAVIFVSSSFTALITA